MNTGVFQQKHQPEMLPAMFVPIPNGCTENQHPKPTYVYLCKAAACVRARSAVPWQ